MTQQVRVTVSDVASQLPTEIYENAGGDAYVIEIPVPGVRPDEIVIEATVDGVTVSTEPRPAEADSGRKYLQRGQSVRSMSRIFEFPMELDTDNVRATLEYGILKIRAPKAVAGKRRVIRLEQTA